MTIKECIDILDAVKPNQYSPEEKIRWLSFLDRTIVIDVLKTHYDYDEKYNTFEGYSFDDTAKKLIVDPPYDEIYVAYLKMKVDEENGETGRYNNSAAMFNSLFEEFKKHYNKVHMPYSKCNDYHYDYHRVSPLRRD